MKETTSFSSGLGSTLVLGGNLHLIASASSRITAFYRSRLDALRSMDDFIHYLIMVFAGGVGGAKGAVGWRVKALGWKEEIWGAKVDDRRRQQITFSLMPLCLLYSLGVVEPPPCPTTTDTFVWVGGSASPHPC